MSGPTEGVELAVPEAATSALYVAIGKTGLGWNHPETAEEAVKAIAAPVVAAELRRLVEETLNLPEDMTSGARVRDVMRRRAAELDGGK